VIILNLPYKPVLTMIRTVTAFAVVNMHKMSHAKFVGLFMFCHGLDLYGTG
jgi:hypothetical protein